MFGRSSSYCFAAILLTSIACAQVPISSGPRSTDELLEALKQDDDHVMRAAAFLLDRGSDPRTVPALKAAFQRTAAKGSKQLTAMVLLRLGVRDREYFEYLGSFAKEAIDSEAPWFLPSPAQLAQPGPRRTVNPDFEAWCIANGKNIEEETRRQWTEYPSDVRLLVSAQDPRAAPLLRKGLTSPNGQIVILSAHGLAEIGDLADVPLLVQASYQNPGTGDGIARALAICARKGSAEKAAVLRAVHGTMLYDIYVRAEKAQEASAPAKE
jgi:hypothetical protein